MLCVNEQRILAAADFLQNVVSINAQLMEEEKASVCHAVINVLYVCAASENQRNHITKSCLLLDMAMKWFAK